MTVMQAFCSGNNQVPSVEYKAELLSWKITVDTGYLRPREGHIKACLVANSKVLNALWKQDHISNLI